LFSFVSCPDSPETLVVTENFEDLIQYQNKNYFVESFKSRVLTFTPVVEEVREALEILTSSFSGGAAEANGAVAA